MVVRIIETPAIRYRLIHFIMHVSGNISVLMNYSAKYGKVVDE